MTGGRRLNGSTPKHTNFVLKKEKKNAKDILRLL